MCGKSMNHCTAFQKPGGEEGNQERMDCVRPMWRTEKGWCKRNRPKVDEAPLPLPPPTVCPSFPGLNNVAAVDNIMKVHEHI